MRIAADWIWDGGGTPYPGILRIEGGVIAGVEPGRVTDEGDADLVLRDTVLLPGFVNAHVHLDLTVEPESERLEGPFHEWLLRVRDHRIAIGDDGLCAAAAAGVQESISGGTTLIVDYDSQGASLASLADSPLRRVILREVISFTNDFDERRPDLLAFLDVNSDPEREVRGIAPHAPYTVHPQLLASLIALASERHVPWSMHIAEQASEDEFLRMGTGDYATFFEAVGLDPSRFPIPEEGPIEAIAHANALAFPGLLVHANYLSDSDVCKLDRGNAAVVYCPRSHEWFGHEKHPLEELHDVGVAVILGTDGKISNGSLSMLDEMRAVRRAFPELAATRIVEMATVTPRHVLARAGVPRPVLGPRRLVPGEPADIVAVEVEADAGERVLEELVTGGGSSKHTIIAGELMTSA